MTTTAAARTARSPRSPRSPRSTGWVPFALAGRVLVVLGMAVAFSALWMTQFYPRQPGGWAINLAVAEYVIRRHGSNRTVSRRTIGATAKVGSS